jgi:uncharacterized membrane protein
MRYLPPFVLTFCWAMWFGGIITLLLAVSAVFGEFPLEHRATAGKATAAMFRAFGLYELALAAGAMIGAVALRLRYPSALRTAIFVLLALSAIAASVTTGVVTPAIEELRRAGESNTVDFKRLHGQAMMLFASRTLLLLVVGVLLPNALQLAPREALNNDRI